MARRSMMVLAALVGGGLWLAPAEARQDNDGAATSAQTHADGRIPADAMDVPGPVHAFLAKRAGKYTTVTRFRPPPTSAPTTSAPTPTTSRDDSKDAAAEVADVSEGTATITSVLDGRFIVEENEGQMMGNPVKGSRVMGYNNRSGRFEATWLYTYSTATLFLKGETEDLGRTITLAGAFESGPGQMLPIKARIRHGDEDHFTVEVLSATAEGVEYAILETAYTRVRDQAGGE